MLRTILTPLDDVQEYEDVQLTAFLSALTKSTNTLNDVRGTS